jgi:Tol biopolymer transport system component
MRLRSILFLTTAVLALALATPATRQADAAAIKLNDSFAASGLVFEQLAFSPDSSRVVAIGLRQGTRELYSAPRGGGAFVRLDVPPAGGGDVLDFWISPDSARVLYRFVREQPLGFANGAAVELYAVPIGGGAALRLSGDLGASVAPQLAFSSDGGRVVFQTQSRGREAAPLAIVSVPLGGGAPVTLASSNSESGPVGGFAVSPDGSFVVYQQGTLAPDARRLLRVPIGGGESVRISQSLSIIGTVTSFQISAGTPPLVVYQSELRDGQGAPLRSLYSVPLAGGPPVKLSASHPQGTTPADYQLTPDGQRLVYATKYSVDLWAQGGDAPPARGLFTTPLSRGSISTIVSDTYLWDGFQLTPDSAGVVYRARFGDAGSRLYYAAFAGGQPQVLNRPDTPGTTIDGYVVGAAGRVAYAAAGPGQSAPALFGVPLAGGEPIALSSGQQVEELRLSPSGGQLAFVATLAGSARKELFGVPLAGGAAVRLSEALPAGAVLAGFALSPDGTTAVFGARQLAGSAAGGDAAFGQALFSVPLAGGAAARFELAPAIGDVVERFAVSRDGRFVAYASRQETGGLSYYARPVLGAAPRRLSDALPAGGTVEDFGLSPDGQRAVVQLREAGGVALYSLDLGGAGAQKLGDGLPATIDSFQISPDGRQLLVLALPPEASGGAEIYSLPLAGGAAQRLGELPTQAEVPLIGPDSASVLYRVPDDDGSGFVLVTSALDGSASRELAEVARPCGPLAATSDGTVVYLGGSSERCDLYSLPGAGGEPRKLNGGPAENRLVWQFELSRDGRQLVYLAESAEGDIGLYRVAVGGGESVRLGGTLRLGDSSLAASYAISADGRFVVFTGSAEDGPTGLYRVALEEGAPEPQAIYLPADDSRIAGFRLSGDGERVVFQAGQESVGVSELYSAPLDGSAAPRKLSAALAPGGDVTRFALAPDSPFVLYLAEQGARNLNEIFAADFGPPPLASSEYQLRADGSLVISATLRLPSLITSTLEYRVATADAGGGLRREVVVGRLSFAPGQTLASATLKPGTSWIPKRGERVVALLGDAGNVTLPVPVQLELPLADRGRMLPLLLR